MPDKSNSLKRKELDAAINYTFKNLPMDSSYLELRDAWAAERAYLVRLLTALEDLTITSRSIRTNVNENYGKFHKAIGRAVVALETEYRRI